MGEPLEATYIKGSRSTHYGYGQTPSRSYRLTETTECQARPVRQRSIVPGKQTLRLAPVGRSEH